MKPFQIVVMGAENVGKTSIIHRFLYGTFKEKTSPTLGESYHEFVKLPGGLHMVVEILDTAGLQEFPAMRDLYIQNGHYFVVVYAVDNEESFLTAQNLCNKIRNKRGIDFQNIVLVGNKMDNVSARKVSTVSALNIAALDMKICFLESSASLNFNTSSIFHTIIKKHAELTKAGRPRIYSDTEIKYQRIGSGPLSSRKFRGLLKSFS